MNPYTTTEHILHSQWNLEHCEFNGTPADWHYTEKLTPDCITIWEVVHYEPGVVGIYAAHHPYCEYYVVVNCASAHRIDSWKTFEGIRAATLAIAYAQSAGVKLDITSSWSNLISST